MKFSQPFFTHILGILTIIYFKGADAEQLNLFCSGAPLEVRLSQNKIQYLWIFHQLIDSHRMRWGQPCLPGEPECWPDHPPQVRKGPRISRLCQKGEWSTICPFLSGLLKLNISFDILCLSSLSLTITFFRSEARPPRSRLVRRRKRRLDAPWGGQKVEHALFNIHLVLNPSFILRFVNVVETFGGRKKGSNSNSE